MSETEANPNMGKNCPQCGAPLPSGVLEGLCPACLLKQGAATDTAVPPEAPPFQPPEAGEVARLFPQLEILGFIGKGGMGAVYKARQPALDRIVALKILPPQSAGGPGFIERFNREARALAKLTHPNIVAVYEFGQVNGLPFFIMEFVDGLNLRQLERTGKLSAREALQIVPQICEALQFAHDEGIVHRDIKPENILIDKKGRVKIADFGIAKILGGDAEAAITETKGAIGTPHYMAPEQMEKPTTVDHRADIFSLGVVFYEMLTGELPLGKFAPPSSRKVEVDVRLDDVVLRALEKDPDRRYQHVSQVKTAVDTISSTKAVPPPTSGESMAGEILARDYHLNIRSCLRRAWALVRKDFWRLIGVTLLVLALLAIAGSMGMVVGPGSRHDASPFGASVLLLLVYGPLTGGLALYYLRKIRGEPVTIEVAFSGLSSRYLHLFLAGFVIWGLTALGFVCFVLPGIYLMVAWFFGLALVADKQIDFWSAMELSRKVATRHWWKLLWFLIVLFFTSIMGALLLGVGIFVTVPVAMLAAIYAYEDIFGVAGQPAVPPMPGGGPSGTVVLPPPALRGPWWRIAPTAGLVALLLVVAAVLVFLVHAIRHASMERARALETQPEENLPPAEPPPPIVTYSFGPVVEREIQARVTGTNQFLDLDSEKLLTPSTETTQILAVSQPRDDENRLWEGLDIADGSRRFQYISWLRESGADLMYAGDGKVIGFDGVFPMAHGSSSTNWDDWDGLTPDQVRAAVDVVDWTRRAAVAQLHGEAAPPAPSPGGVYNSAAQLDSREGGGPVVNMLTRDQSVTWFFKTREGGEGVLQIVSFTGSPGVAKIRYKLIRQSDGQSNVVSAVTDKTSRENLSARIEAASMMMNMSTKDKALAAVAVDAARAGEVELVQNALGQINSTSTQGQAALDSVRVLVRRGLRKQATEVAQNINDIGIHDQALSVIAK